MFLTLVIGLGVVGGFLLTIPFQQDQEKSERKSTQEKINEEETKVFYKKDIRNAFTSSTNQNKGESSLEFSLTPSDSVNKKFLYQVKNIGNRKTTLEFSTSQRYELIIEKEGEGEIFRYSNGRVFMQVLGQVELGPAEEESYSITLPDLQPGNYKLTVYLVAKKLSEVSKQSHQFSVSG